MKHRVTTAELVRVFFCGLFISFAAGEGSLHLAAAGLEADWVFHNGKILTADADTPGGFSIVQAVAIYDGKFVVVGSNAEALATAGPSTKRIDLQGKTVLPGLIETHLHVNTQAVGHHLKKTASATDFPLQGRRSEVLEQIRGLAQARKPGDWIVLNSVRLLRADERAVPGGGGNPFGAESEPPLTLAELDSVAPNNPVLIGGGYFPSQVNTQALNILYARYPDIPGVRKGSDGKPTGTIEITAAFTIQELTPTPTPKQIEATKEGFRKELEEAAARGLTAVATRVDWDALRAYMLIDKDNQMPLRLAFATEFGAYSPQTDILFRRINMAPGFGSPWLFISGVTTGTAEYGSGPVNGDACIYGTYSHDAAETFPNWADQPWGSNGDCRMTAGANAKVLRDFFINAARSGWDVTNLHINGDKGLDDYMDLLEEIERNHGVDVASLRFSSDHCGYISQEQSVRAKRLGISFSCTPNSFMNGARGTVGAYTEIYDRERAADAYSPFRRLARSDMKPSAHCEGHQDWEFLCMEHMMTRKDQTTGAVWGPQQTIDRREALYTYTRWAAWHVWKEDHIGSIEPGKWADLVVIDKDFMSLPPEEFSEINTLLTVAGGRVTFSNPTFASGVGLPTVGFQAPADWWVKKPRGGEGGM